MDRRPASDPPERGLERGVSILLGIEGDDRNGDSRDYSEEKDFKGRIIAGTGAIAPVAGQYEWGFRFYSLHKDPHHHQLPSRPNRVSAYIWNPAGGEGAGAYFQDKLVKGRWLHIVACYQPGDKTNPAAGVQVYKDSQLRLGPPSPGTLYSNPEFLIMPAHGTAPLRLGTRDLGSFFRGGLGGGAIYPCVLAGPPVPEP